MQVETTSPSASRHLWADFVRNLGILLVILGHVSAIVVQRWQTLPPADWMAGNVYNVIARACVPLLFMVSGALLLPRQESIRDFYRKRFQKVIFPFLFWSVLYLVVKAKGYPGADPLAVIRGITVTIMVKPAEYHLWFMYELFGLYLITPILRVIIASGRDEYLWYFLGIWFIFGPLQSLVEFLTNFSFIFDLGYLTGYVGYFLLGYLLIRFPLRKWLVWSAAVYLASAVFTGYITYLYSGMIGRLDTTFQNLLGVNIVFLSVSAFILLKAAGERVFANPHPRLAKWAVHLTSVSYGMYLIHVFVLDALREYSISPLEGPAIYMIPVATIAVFIVSWALISILIKIPILRALVA